MPGFLEAGVAKHNLEKPLALPQQETPGVINVFSGRRPAGHVVVGVSRRHTAHPEARGWSRNPECLLERPKPSVWAPKTNGPKLERGRFSLGI